MNVKTYTSKQIQWLKENYPIKSIDACCQYMQRSLPGLKAILFKNKIKKSIYFNYKPININLSSPEMCYFLGYIWADGHIRKQGNKIIFSMEIQEEDGNILIPLLNKIGAFKKLNRQKPNRKKTILFTNREKNFNQLLYKNNYAIKSKSQPLKILHKIPKNLHYIWWRGYFDGDGCICIPKSSLYKSLSISGPYSYNWNFFTKLLIKMKIKYKIRQRKLKNNHKSSLIEIFKYKDIIKFFNYIYPLSYDGIGLKRKYDKFYMIKNHQMN